MSSIASRSVLRVFEKWSVSGVSIFLLMGCVLWTGALHAQEQQEIEESREIALEVEEMRDWPTPVGTSPYTALVDHGVDGVTLLVMGRGDEEDEECVIVVSDTTGARAYSYRHDFHPTRCLDALAIEGGGFFVRGQRADTPTEEGGFTSRIDLDGEVLWSVDDEEFLDDFVGDYAGAIPTLAYDAENDRLFGLAMGVVLLPGGGRMISQAHILEGESGQIQVSGRTFGQLGNDLVVDALARDGQFLVHTLDGTTEQPRFFSYDGEASITLVAPGSQDWSAREVHAPLAHYPPRGLFVLWTARGPQTSGITAVDVEDELIWSRDYFGEAEIGGEFVELGRADRVWVGSELVALRYRNQQLQYFLRFIDHATGEDLGVLSWDRMVEYDAIDMVRGEEGRLRLVAVDPSEGRVWELAIELVDAPDQPDPEEPEAGGEEEGGCRKSPGGPAPLFVLVFCAWWLTCRSLPKFGPGSRV